MTISTLSPTRTLSDEHRKFLENQAIPTAHALEAGVFSVMEVSDLPSDLANSEDLVPGIVFTHRQPDGQEVHQLRPDTPPEHNGRPLKYIQTPGTGSILSIHPSRAHLIGNAERITIVEGTKQALAASFYAAPEVLVVGVQGCRNWSANGLPIAGLSEILGTGSDVVVLFDADVSRNREVYDAANLLGRHLRTNGAKDVRYALLPASGTNGLDDYLGSLPERKRASALEYILGDAAKLPGRAPAKSNSKPQDDDRPTIAAIVDWATASIIGSNRDGLPIRTASFAARIIRTHTITDDLNDPTGAEIENVHDIEVIFEPDGEIYTIVGVTDEDLENPRKWLRRAPDALGTRIDRRSGRDVDGEIGQAIRSYEKDNAEVKRGLRRTGPATVDGIPGFVHAGGFITADGNTELTRAILRGRFAHISYPDPAALTPTERRDATKASLGLMACLVDPTSFMLVMGHMAHGVTGAKIETVAAIIGPPSTGKTNEARGIASHLSPAFGPRGSSMVSGQGTPGIIATAGQRLHHTPIILDDALRGRNDAKAQGLIEDAVDTFIRRTYGGGLEGRDRLDRDAKGAYEAHESDASNPVGVIVGEVLPNNPSTVSGLERLFPAHVARANLFRGDKEILRYGEIAESGGPNASWGMYLQWLARHARDDGLAAWITQIEAEVEKVKGELATSHPVLNDRSRRVAAGPIVGWNLYMRFIHDATPGVLSASRRDELIAQGRKLLAAAMVKHTSISLGSDQRPEARMLNDLRAIIGSSSQWLILEPGGVLDKDRTQQRAVGDIVRVQHDGKSIEVVAITPSVAAEALGFKRSEGDVITRTLGPIAVKDSSGKTTRVIKSVRRICIPLDIWNGDTDRIPQPDGSATVDRQPGGSGGNDTGGPVVAKTLPTSINDLEEVDA